MPTAFVTGGSGFVGGALIRRLVNEGWTVRALARSDRSAATERSERASARTVQPSFTSLRISAPPTKPEPPVTNAVGMSAKLARLACGGEVALTRTDHERRPLEEVAHGD